MWADPMEKLKRQSPNQVLIYVSAREVLQSPTAGMHLKKEKKVEKKKVENKINSLSCIKTLETLLPSTPGSRRNAGPYTS